MGSNVSREISRYLWAQGVRRAYGLPGGEVTHLIDAMVEVGIEWVLVHHESAGAHMADAESQVTGRPAVCVATVGPGATNMVNGIANSYLDRSPVIALIGEFDAEERPGTVHMNVDLPALFSPITNYVERVDPANLSTVLAHTSNALQGPPPGPVALLVSASDQRRPMVAASIDVAAVGNGYERSGADELEARLQTAQKPAMVMGVGARSGPIAEAARAFAAAWDLPVTVTPKAKGWLPSDDPHFAGVLASYGSSGAESMLAESDLIVAIGLDGTDFIRPWRYPAPVRLQAHPWYDPAAPGEELLCSPLLTLNELCERPGPVSDGRERAGRARAKAETDRSSGSLPARPLPEHMRGGLDPVDVLRAVRRGAPRELVAACDVGMFKLAICQYWDTYEPATFLVSNGLSTMAYGLPAAIAAALSTGQPSLALIGDGGLLMGAGEIETLSRLGAPVTVVVAVDSSLALIRLKSEIDDLIEQPNDFNRADYVGLARSLGMSAGRVEDLDQLTTAVADSITSRQPHLIEVPIDYALYRQMGG